jgi:orotate phosphoribosyltransferase-like protein
VLNDRERRIFEARRLADEPMTLEELADEFGVSRERVRQIEVRAFEKVQKAVRHRVAAMEMPETLAVSMTVPESSAVSLKQKRRGARHGFVSPSDEPWACLADIVN